MENAIDAGKIVASDGPVRVGVGEDVGVQTQEDVVLFVDLMIQAEVGKPSVISSLKNSGGEG